MTKKKYGDIIHGDAHVRIGKNFITEGVIEEIISQFDHRDAVKVKFLDLPIDVTISEAGEILAQRTKSHVIDTRGKTCVLRGNNS